MKSELRNKDRTDFGTPVLFSDETRVTHHRAMMQNFSDDGMYFESHDYLKPGSTVYVKTLNYRSVNKCEVRWCNRLETEDEETFGVGLHLL